MDIKKVLLGLINPLLVIIGLILVVKGQEIIGPKYLLQMLFGLALILLAIYRYNKQYK